MCAQILRRDLAGPLPDGVSAGVALALLIAGPTIDLAFLLAIVRQSHRRMALRVAVAAWADRGCRRPV